MILAVVAIAVIVLLAVVAAMVFWILMLVDAASRQFIDQTTKIVWILIIFFLHFVGAIVYYFTGRSQGQRV